MLIGAYGVFWDREVYDWRKASKRRLIGRQGEKGPKFQIADFSRASGIYVLYNEVGVYYVGLAAGEGGLSARLCDHTKDRHAGGWSRFSWFAFDSPSTNGDVDDEGVIQLETWSEYESLDTKTAIKESEAILIAALMPPGNKQKMRFGDGELWLQVAMTKPPVPTFDEFKDRLTR